MSGDKCGKCAVCGIQASQTCSACKSVQYCGAEHQKKHWKIHKHACRPFTIAHSDELGRYLCATRDIPANTVIFNENPLVVGPKWYLNEKEEYSPIVPCVGCFAPCRVGVYGCPNCLWPACSPNCAGLDNSKLHGMECPILCLGIKKIDSSNMKALMDYYRTDTLIVLKCLMLQRKMPKKWLELMDMQSHENERKGSELQQDAENRIVSFLMRNFLEPLKALEAKSKKILEQCDMNILHKICGIIETNYMCINLLNGMELSGLFYTACMMEHSCVPNCFFSFDHNNGFKISVTAGCDIKKGEHLRIMYSNMLWGTQMRQEHLALTKHFQCRCERCCDRTELGTYFSGLRCIGPEAEACAGIQLPEDPLAEKTDWVCNKCPMRISSEEVRYLNTQMGDEVESLLSSKPTIEGIETLIEKLSNFVHKNHYHLFSLKHTIIQMYGSQKGYLLKDLSDNQLLKKIEIATDLLSVCDKLDPNTIRLSLYVAIILNEMQSATVEYYKRQLEQFKDSNGKKKEVLIEFQKVENWLARAKRVLEKELDTVQGNKLNDALNKSIENVEYLIASFKVQ